MSFLIALLEKYKKAAPGKKEHIFKTVSVAASESYAFYLELSN